MTIAEFYANFAGQSQRDYNTGKSPFWYKGGYLYSVRKDNGQYLANCGSDRLPGNWTVTAQPDDEIKAAPDASREQ